MLTKLSLLLSILVPTVASADRLDEILAEMARAGDALESLSADFRETKHDYILEDEERKSGTLSYRVPGRIRWEYTEPSEVVLLVKGDLVRLYNRTAKQVHEFERGKGGHSGGLDLLVGFGGNNDKIAENYDASLVEEGDDTVLLKLVPKPTSAASMFASIDLEIDKETWTPARSVFHEVSRNRTEIVFEGMELNQPLADDVFELELPGDVEIVKND